MEINDILKTQLQQVIQRFEKFEASKIEENTQVSKELIDALQHLNIPKEIVSHNKITHHHINGGVRFMLITLISVILSAVIVSGYFYNENMQLTEFKNHYVQYQKQLQWHEKFFNYMAKKNPRDTKTFLKDNSSYK